MYHKLLSEVTAINPHALLHEMRPSKIQWLNELQAWIVLDYKDCNALYMEKRIQPGGIASMLNRFQGEKRVQLEPLYQIIQQMTLVLPDDRFKVVRNIILKYFSDNLNLYLAKQAKKIADTLLFQCVEQGRVDIIKMFCNPLPVMVIAEIFGVPDNDLGQFLQWSDDILLIFLFTSTHNEVLRGQAAYIEMANYCIDLMEQRIGQKGSDLLSIFGEAERAGILNRSEIRANCPFLLFAGHDPVRSTIAECIKYLCENPSELKKLQNQPQLARNAIQETLRMQGPSAMVSRTVKESFCYDGFEFKRDQLIFLSNHSANRDPNIFSAPDVFKLDRPFKPNTHLGFGIGPHFCLGAQLALAEGEAALQSIINIESGIYIDLSTIKYKTILPANRMISELIATFK